MNCDFHPTSEPDARGWTTWECSRCGQKAALAPPGITYRCRVPGWGDYLSYYIAWFTGITKADLNKWLGKDCGCGKRQEAVNTWGEWLTRVFGYRRR